MHRAPITDEEPEIQRGWRITAIRNLQYVFSQHHQAIKSIQALAIWI